MSDPIILRRSLIMVSALRPDDFRRAAESGADMVCADLEDGTVPARRSEARAGVFDIFGGSARPGLQRLLRINSPRTSDGLRDISSQSSSAARRRTDSSCRRSPIRRRCASSPG